MLQTDSLVSEQDLSTVDWRTANRQYIDSELRRLRLLLNKRVLWLRRKWNRDPLAAYQGLVISDARADALLGGDDAAARTQFFQQDEQVRDLDAMLAAVEQEQQNLQEAMRRAGQPAALDTVARLYGLTAFEQDVLLLCLAPELDGSFAVLDAYAQDDVNARYPTPALALALFGEADNTGVEAHVLFLPDAPLHYFRLIESEASAAYLNMPLRLSPVILEFILTANARLDDRIVAALRPVTASLARPSHAELVERLTRWIKTDIPRGTWRGVNLVGAHGTGKQALARAVCKRAGWELVNLDPMRLPNAENERTEFLRLLERDAVLGRLAVYLDTTEAQGKDAALINAVRDILNHCRVFTFVASDEAWRNNGALLTARMSKPDEGERRAMWRQSLDAEELPDASLDEVVQQFEVGPGDIPQIVAAARGQARLKSGEEARRLTAEDLWQACREQAGTGMDDLAQRIRPCYTWSDIILPEDTLTQLRELAAQVSQRARVYETWGFGEKLSRGRGINALFAGASGVGKTMAAEVLANHLKLDLYHIDLAGVVSKYIGETEKNLRRVFDAAERSGAILFFDEADALFGKRSEVKDSHDRYANIEINYLLQRMEAYRGLAILATNMKSLMDQAFLRRLRFLIDFPFPDTDLRLRIWKGVFPRAAQVEGLDYESLARLEVPGGNIKNIAVNGAFMAASEDQPIRMTHLLRAARREYVKLDRLMTEAEFSAFASAR